MSTPKKKRTKEPSKKSGQPGKNTEQELTETDLDRAVGGSGTTGNFERVSGTIGTLPRKDPYK
jgi:hypothetical protein